MQQTTCVYVLVFILETPVGIGGLAHAMQDRTDILIVEPAIHEKSQTQTLTSHNDLFIINEPIDFPVVAPQQAGRKTPTRNDECIECPYARDVLTELRASLRPP